MVTLTEAAKRRGKLLPLATDIEVNNYFSSEIIEHKNGDFFSLFCCCQQLSFWRAMTERPRSWLFLADK